VMWDSDVFLMARAAPFEYGLVRINVRYSLQNVHFYEWHDEEMTVSLYKWSCAHGTFP